MELIPPDRFIFRGFGLVRATDITDQEVLSALKRDLIEKESIASGARFERLQLQLRTFFRRPDLRLTLAAFQGERVLVLKTAPPRAQLHLRGLHPPAAPRLRGEHLRARGGPGLPLLVDDLETYSPRRAIEDSLLRAGIATSCWPRCTTRTTPSASWRWLSAPG